MYEKNNFSAEMLAKMSKLADYCFYLKLKGRDILLDMSASTMSKHYNGVGLDWKPEYLLHLIPHISDDFEAAGLLQDLHYAIDPNRTIENFHKVNADFKKNCETIAKAKYRWFDTRRYFLKNSANKLFEASEKSGLEFWLKARLINNN